MTNKMSPPDRLFRYASKYAERAEKSGRGTQWPTSAMAAKALRVRVGTIEEIANSYQGDGYLGLSYWYTQEYINGAVAPGKMLVEAYD